MMYRYDSFLFGGRWFGLLFMIGCAIVFVLLIVWLIRRTDDTHHHTAPPTFTPPPFVPPAGPYGAGAPGGFAAASPAADPALLILRERFARGEITEAEFLSASRTLGSPHP
ncbi:MAG: SHOCT domain-containing protein [Candidatus Limnocylindrales bacterium]|nr:SHOCT domain-containing protein [Chloroflexota bacterium]